MKYVKVTLILMVLGCIESCVHILPDGRKYQLESICIEKHEESRFEMEFYGEGVYIPTWKMVTVCDSFQVDTIWVK